MSGESELRANLASEQRTAQLAYLQDYKSVFDPIRSAVLAHGDLQPGRYSVNGQTFEVLKVQPLTHTAVVEFPMEDGRAVVAKFLDNAATQEDQDMLTRQAQAYMRIGGQGGESYTFTNLLAYDPDGHILIMEKAPGESMDDKNKTIPGYNFFLVDAYMQTLVAATLHAYENGVRLDLHKSNIFRHEHGLSFIDYTLRDDSYTPADAIAEIIIGITPFTLANTREMAKELLKRALEGEDNNAGAQNTFPEELFTEEFWKQVNKALRKIPQ